VILGKEDFDGSLIFENLVTGKMPPADKDQPDAKEKRELLEWLAGWQGKHVGKSFRRISRHEFVYSLNDLLGTDLDLAGWIPEDRGTNDFDSNRKIQLSREMLGSYFSVADEMLDHAFPDDGFPAERSWVTSKVRDSHETTASTIGPIRKAPFSRGPGPTMATAILSSTTTLSHRWQGGMS